MGRRFWFALGLLGILGNVALAAAPAKPNVLVILADDRDRLKVTDHHICEKSCIFKGE